MLSFTCDDKTKIHPDQASECGEILAYRAYRFQDDDRFHRVDVVLRCKDQDMARATVMEAWPSFGFDVTIIALPDDWNNWPGWIEVSNG